MTPYSATKAGVIGLTKSLGKEVATEGICVNAVSPAVVQTQILDQLTAGAGCLHDRQVFPCGARQARRR